MPSGRSLAVHKRLQGYHQTSEVFTKIHDRPRKLLHTGFVRGFLNMKPFALVSAIVGSLVLSVGAQSYGLGYGNPSGLYGGGYGYGYFGSTTNCTAVVYMTQPWPLWGSKSSHGTVLNFYVTNYESYITDTTWTFSVSNPNYKTIEQTPWNWNNLKIADGVIDGDAQQVWQALSPGRSANLGCIVGGDVTTIAAFFPKTAKVNGFECSIKLGK
ncbi:hypothetical protein WJX73_000426 [Symbiochloris irregularis]|uniref:Uncharacterized protein n=1 Tax=Symbiochloris irregularis TaxID=706552 RepID=A0AAW1P108_9CHLO